MPKKKKKTIMLFIIIPLITQTEKKDKGKEEGNEFNLRKID